MDINVVTLRIALKPTAKVDHVTDWLNEVLGGDIANLVLDWGYILPERELVVPDDYKEGDFIDALNDDMGEVYRP